MNLGIINQFQGQYTQSVACYEEAIPLAKALKNTRLLARLYVNLALVQELLGQFQAGLNSLQEAEPLAHFMGTIDLQIRIQSTEGFIRHYLGQDQQAVIVLKKAIALAQRQQVQEAEVYPRINLAAVQLALNQHTECEAHLNRANIICQELALTFLLPELRRVQAQLAFARQQMDVAQTLLDESLQVAKQKADGLQEGRSWRLQGDI